MPKSVLLHLIFIVPIVHADCSSLLKYNTPDNQFQVIDDGLAKHKTTGLLWMRCSIGQSWNGTDCIGDAALMGWADAIELAASNVTGKYSDWRLPNKNELDSIVETACSQPSINKFIFPQTSSVAYWTSSPYQDQEKYIWAVYFNNGTIFPRAGNLEAAIRLVRDITE